jgi:hypothetical protein
MTGDFDVTRFVSDALARLDQSLGATGHTTPRREVVVFGAGAVGVHVEAASGRARSTEDVDIHTLAGLSAHWRPPAPVQMVDIQGIPFCTPDWRNNLVEYSQFSGYSLLHVRFVSPLDLVVMKVGRSRSKDIEVDAINLIDHCGLSQQAVEDAVDEAWRYSIQNPQLRSAVQRGMLELFDIDWVPPED